MSIQTNRITALEAYKVRALLEDVSWRNKKNEKEETCSDLGALNQFKNLVDDDE